MKHMLRAAVLRPALRSAAWAACWLASVGTAPAGALLYQWDFNGTPGTTVAPAVGTGGVLTMSQVTSNGSALSGPTAADLYGAAGSGVFSNANPNDRAFNNSGTVYGISAFSDPGSKAGMVSSNNTGITSAPDSTLSATAGVHDRITMTAWVKLDEGQLLGEFPRLVQFGSPNYDGNNIVSPNPSMPPTGINGTYFGFFNSGQDNKFGTLQFKSNGGLGLRTNPNVLGFVGETGIIDSFAGDWMFLAVTYDATIPVTIEPGSNPPVATSPPNVQFYVGNKTVSLGNASSAGPLPINGTTSAQNLNTAGPVDLNNNSVYIGNRVNLTAPMSAGVGALIDDVRIYDGVLSRFELDFVRRNLSIPEVVPGDFDLNDIVNAADIPIMVQALADLKAYQTTFNVSDSDLQFIGDVNGDAAITNADLQALLSQIRMVTITPGDFDLSGKVDAADIAVMTQALVDLNAYQSSRGLADADLKTIADINEDNAITNADLQALLTQLIAGGGSISAVPEPRTAVLAMAAMFGFLLCGRYPSRQKVSGALGALLPTRAKWPEFAHPLNTIETQN